MLRILIITYNIKKKVNLINVKKEIYMIIGRYDFKEGDKVYHKRFKKEGIFKKYINEDYGVIKIGETTKKISLALLEKAK